MNGFSWLVLRTLWVLVQCYLNRPRTGNSWWYIRSALLGFFFPDCRMAFFEMQHGISSLDVSGEVIYWLWGCRTILFIFQEADSGAWYYPENIYNSDDTGPIWFCLPASTFAGADEDGASGFRRNKNFIAVFRYVNVLAHTESSCWWFQNASGQAHSRELPICQLSTRFWLMHGWTGKLFWTGSFFTCSCCKRTSEGTWNAGRHASCSGFW